MTDAVEAALIVSVGPTLMGLASLVTSLRNSRKLNEVTKKVNGQLSEMVAIRTRADRAEGKEEERGEARERARHGSDAPAVGRS